MGECASPFQSQELRVSLNLYPSKQISMLNQGYPFAIKRVGECKTKTPTVKKGFDVSGAESTRFELVHPS